MTMDDQDTTADTDEQVARLLALSTDSSGTTSVQRLPDDLARLVGGDLPAFDMAQEEHDQRDPSQARGLPGARLVVGVTGN